MCVREDTWRLSVGEMGHPNTGAKEGVRMKMALSRTYTARERKE